ncbi:MAG: lytic transglycosylase domain-containing protein [Gemmatimonadota bacterium]
MKDLSKSYVHRGDAERRKRRVRGAIMLAGVLTAGTTAARNWEPAIATATPLAADAASVADVQRLRSQIERARGDLRLASAQLERWNRIFHFSHKYKIPADMAGAIYDAAIIERVDPELAFPLVKLESGFIERARSEVGAIGLTQLMLGTAKYYDSTLTREKLYDRNTNLRIGFRYLRDLIKEQRGDIQMALLAYNRGPMAVQVAKELDLDASNGYDRIVLKGYRGKGILD